MGVSGKAIDDRERERIRKLREQGMSIRQVATVATCNPSTVQRILKSSR